MMKFYQDPFDITKPPPAPPNREFFMVPFVGRIYTKDSDQQQAEYMQRLSEYGSKIAGMHAKDNELIAKLLNDNRILAAANREYYQRLKRKKLLG